MCMNILTACICWASLVCSTCGDQKREGIGTRGTRTAMWIASCYVDSVNQ